MGVSVELLELLIFVAAVCEILTDSQLHNISADEGNLRLLPH